MKIKLATDFNKHEITYLLYQRSTQNHGFQLPIFYNLFQYTHVYCTYIAGIYAVYTYNHHIK